jgi:hypothetical protein
MSKDQCIDLQIGTIRGLHNQHLSLQDQNTHLQHSLDVSHERENILNAEITRLRTCNAELKVSNTILKEENAAFKEPEWRQDIESYKRAHSRPTLRYTPEGQKAVKTVQYLLEVVDHGDSDTNLYRIASELMQEVDQYVASNPGVDATGMAMGPNGGNVLVDDDVAIRQEDKV